MDLYVVLPILLGVGVVAGFLNVMAGGGSTITLPVLIFLGLDPSLANGTNRVAILVQNIFATWSFKRTDIPPTRQSYLFALLTIPGAIAGAVFAVRISDEIFETILGVLLIVIVITLFMPANRNARTGQPAGNWLTYPAMVCIGFYGGFIQVGVGFLFMAVLRHLERMDLVRINAYKVLIVLVYTLPALIIFAVTDNINWTCGLSLAAGNAIGGWWAARWSAKKGENLVRIVLAVAILIMSARLLGFF